MAQQIQTFFSSGTFSRWWTFLLSGRVRFSPIRSFFPVGNFFFFLLAGIPSLPFWGLFFSIMFYLSTWDASGEPPNGVLPFLDARSLPSNVHLAIPFFPSLRPLLRSNSRPPVRGSFLCATPFSGIVNILGWPPRLDDFARLLFNDCGVRIVTRFLFSSCAPFFCFPFFASSSP